MADVNTQDAPVETPALPDYLLDPNAVLKDTANWRYGKAPDYSNTRKVFNESMFTLLNGETIVLLTKKNIFKHC